jgi:ribonuclease HI
MICTIITDASYDWNTKSGAWAVWIKSNRGTYEGAKALTPKMGSSTVAEVLAAANGIYIARKRELIVPGDRIVIRVDNLAAMDHCKGTVKKTKIVGFDMKLIVQARELIRGICKEGIEVDYRHIKAHSGVSKADKWVHNKVDKMAYKAMVLARAK